LRHLCLNLHKIHLCVILCFPHILCGYFPTDSTTTLCISCFSVRAICLSQRKFLMHQLNIGWSNLRSGCFAVAVYLKAVHCNISDLCKMSASFPTQKKGLSLRKLETEFPELKKFWEIQYNKIFCLSLILLSAFIFLIAQNIPILQYTGYGRYMSDPLSTETCY
jgi:hypothetical protein